MTEKEFVVNWTKELSTGLLKSFPNDFIFNLETEELSIPEIPLVLGSELFGSFEITDVEGASVLTCENLYKAKYILYANRERPAVVSIPVIEEEVEKTVKEFEKHIDLLLHSINANYKKTFPEGKNFLQVSNQIFNSLNLKRY